MCANDPHERIHRPQHSVPGAHGGGDGAAVRAAGGRSARRRLTQAERKLLEARAKRVRPHLDDKILTSWNGLMISAFAHGRRGAGRAALCRRRAARGRFHDRADVRPADAACCCAATAQGDAAIPGFLDDYALFTQALLDLYEAQFDRSASGAGGPADRRSRSSCSKTREHGGFFSTAADGCSLVMRMKEDYDGAEPSGNSVAMLNLLRLAQMTGRADFRESGGARARGVRPAAHLAPVALPQMLVACEFSLAKPRQIVLVGDGRGGYRALIGRCIGDFVPNRIVLLVDSPETRAGTGAAHSRRSSAMKPSTDVPAAYVCRNYACQLPVTEPEKFAELIQ